jgi:hypothetical protein
VWLRTWNILQQLGLDQDLAKIAGTQPTAEPGSSPFSTRLVRLSLTRSHSFHVQLP